MSLWPRPKLVFVYLLYFLTYAAHTNSIRHTEVGQTNQTSDHSLESPLNYCRDAALAFAREQGHPGTHMNQTAREKGAMIARDKHQRKDVALYLMVSSSPPNPENEMQNTGRFLAQKFPRTENVIQNLHSNLCLLNLIRQCLF